MKSLKKMRAFTLIELIVVIVIIGILLALAAVGYLSFVSNSNKKASFATAKQAATVIQGASATQQVRTQQLDWADLGTAMTDDGIAARPGGNSDGVVVYQNAAANGVGTDTIVCAYKGKQVSAIVFEGESAPGSGPTQTFDSSADQAPAATMCTPDDANPQATPTGLGAGTVVYGEFVAP